MKVAIMRGAPGMGKTTLAERMLCEHIKALDNTGLIVSADHTFIQPDGTYKFDRNILGFAHHECLRKYSDAIGQNKDNPNFLLIVDNTNTTVGEMKNYVDLAKVSGVPFKIISVECEITDAFARQAHRVPEDKHWQMWMRYCDAKLPSDWPHEVVRTNSNK